MDTALATATMAATRAPTTALDEIGIGSRIDDFDLLTDLGAGAFARVYLARQRSMQRLVAVKISADHGTEPQTLAHLDHDYIVRVFDQRRVALGGIDVGMDTANAVKLMYMQYVPGGTLRGVLQRVRDTEPALRNGRLLLSAVDGELLGRGGIRPVESRTRADIAALSWPETVAWLGRRLADALDYADRRGVLHRDLKPANVLLTADGAPKLADFNISYAQHVPGANPVAYFGGSLAYMSPEQLGAARPDSRRAAADLDTRSDLYALGMMLWELLTGRRPFDDAALFRAASTRVAMPGGDTLDELLALRRRPIEQRFLDDLPADCPATLRRVLLRCLQPDRDDRPANGREVAAQFDLCLDARARDLVDPQPHGWRARLAPWSVPITTLAGAIGNIAAIAYNKVHNGALTDSTLTAAEHARIHPIGEFLNWPIPVLFALMLFLCRRPLLVPFGLRRGKRYSPQMLARTRADALGIGDRVALIGFTGWVVAGISFVTGLALVTDAPTDLLIHVLVSLLVCGAISVSYPFFLTTLWFTRCVYPPLLREGHVTEADARRLDWLARRATVYLAIAASVPLIGVVAGVSFLLPGQIPLIINSMRWLCVGAAIAFIGVYWLFRVLEADIRALERVVSGRRTEGR